MRKLILLAAPLALLCACAPDRGASIPMTAEKADTVALDSYAAVAASVNAYEAAPTTTAAQKVGAEALRDKAWSLLGKEHALYKSGIVGDVTAIEGLVTLAANLGK